jgi:hypothetical protein
MTLIGSWVIDESDHNARAKFGDVELAFDNESNLTYTIRTDEKQQIILLRYEIENDTIVTDQPSRPQIERTSFSFLDDGRLMLAFGGEPAYFRRRRGA